MCSSDLVKGESPTRLYVAAKNMLHRLNRNSNAQEVHHFVEFLTLYPGDLRVAVMKDLRNTYERVYAYAIEDDLFEWRTIYHNILLGLEIQHTLTAAARAMKELAKQNPQMTAVFVSNYEMTRSEERRVGKECSEPCRSRWSPYH